MFYYFAELFGFLQNTLSIDCISVDVILYGIQLCLTASLARALLSPS